jgi:hypothetical protein
MLSHMHICQLPDIGMLCLTLFASPSLLQDETALIWYSHKKEKFLRLSSVSKVIPGQRTVSLLLSVLNNNNFLAGITIPAVDIKRRACILQ